MRNLSMAGERVAGKGGGVGREMDFLFSLHGGKPMENGIGE